MSGGITIVGVCDADGADNASIRDKIGPSLVIDATGGFPLLWGLFCELLLGDRTIFGRPFPLLKFINKRLNFGENNSRLNTYKLHKD